jgi:hypothetical protein
MHSTWLPFLDEDEDFLSDMSHWLILAQLQMTMMLSTQILNPKGAVGVLFLTLSASLFFAVLGVIANVIYCETSKKKKKEGEAKREKLERKLMATEDPAEHAKKRKRKERELMAMEDPAEHARRTEELVAKPKATAPHEPLTAEIQKDVSTGMQKGFVPGKAAASRAKTNKIEGTSAPALTTEIEKAKAAAELAAVDIPEKKATMEMHVVAEEEEEVVEEDEEALMSMAGEPLDQKSSRVAATQNPTSPSTGIPKTKGTSTAELVPKTDEEAREETKTQTRYSLEFKSTLKSDKEAAAASASVEKAKFEIEAMVKAEMVVAEVSVAAPAPAPAQAPASTPAQEEGGPSRIKEKGTMSVDLDAAAPIQKAWTEKTDRTVTKRSAEGGPGHLRTPGTSDNTQSGSFEPKGAASRPTTAPAKLEEVDKAVQIALDDVSSEVKRAKGRDESAWVDLYKQEHGKSHTTASELQLWKEKTMHGLLKERLRRQRLVLGAFRKVGENFRRGQEGQAEGRSHAALAAVDSAPTSLKSTGNLHAINEHATGDDTRPLRTLGRLGALHVGTFESGSATGRPTTAPAKLEEVDMAVQDALDEVSSDVKAARAREKGDWETMYKKEHRKSDATASEVELWREQTMQKLLTERLERQRLVLGALHEVQKKYRRGQGGHHEEGEEEGAESRSRTRTRSNSTDG